jgi:hypothetical protein
MIKDECFEMVSKVMIYVKDEWLSDFSRFIISFVTKITFTHLKQKGNGKTNL